MLFQWLITVHTKKTFYCLKYKLYNFCFLWVSNLCIADTCRSFNGHSNLSIPCLKLSEISVWDLTIIISCFCIYVILCSCLCKTCSWNWGSLMILGKFLVVGAHRIHFDIFSFIPALSNKCPKTSSRWAFRSSWQSSTEAQRAQAGEWWGKSEV